jgi:hypothetical protein
VGVPTALVRHVPAVAQQARALETNPLEALTDSILRF